MKVIELTRGYAAIVDDEDFDALAQYRWCAAVDNNTVYAIRRSGKTTVALMHRLIMNAPADMQVDHRNGNGLDNRRCNLRLATHGQNTHNAKVRSDNVLGLKGVYFHKKHQKFCAAIQVNKKRIHLGLFDTVEAAKAARDKAAEQYHGEFARLN